LASLKQGSAKVKSDKKVVAWSVPAYKVTVGVFDPGFDVPFSIQRAGPFIAIFRIFLNLFLGVIHNLGNPWGTRLTANFENPKSDIQVVNGDK
jgi:hypothetical protein